MMMMQQRQRNERPVVEVPEMELYCKTVVVFVVSAGIRMIHADHYYGSRMTMMVVVAWILCLMTMTTTLFQKELAV